MIAAVLVSLATAQAMEDLPLPTAPGFRVQAALTPDTLPTDRPGGAFWVSHRVAKGFVIAEGVGAGLAVVGASLMLPVLVGDGAFDSTFTAGSVLVVSGAVLGLSAAPGALFSATYTWGKAPKGTPATGLVIGYLGLGLMSMFPILAASGEYSVGPVLFVAGSTLGCLSGPIQLGINDARGRKRAVIPTPNGVTLGGTFCAGWAETPYKTTRTPT